MDCNLLVDQCITVLSQDGRENRMNLPQLFCALERDQVLSFASLLPHQAHLWHAFICQLAAMALQDESLPDAGCEPHKLLGQHSEENWLSLLRALAPGFDNDSPWRLVVEDLSQPAFMQPPVQEGSLDKYGKNKKTPADLDVLVSSKNHGIKTGKMQNGGIDDWIFALVSLQTHGPFLGAGNYGIARQNGGFGTRPGISLVTSTTTGGQWARDVRVILDNTAFFVDSPIPYDQDNGKRLLWLEPWDGTSSLELAELHPLFIEICRKVRLINSNGSIEAPVTGTKVARVAAKEQNGNLLDPWIPVRVKDSAAFNTRPSYKSISSVLFDNKTYKPSLLQRIHDVDSGRAIAARFRVLVRGQGKTEGYEDRLVPIPEESRGLFQEQPDRLAVIAGNMIQYASDTEYKALKPALVSLLQPARSTPDYKQKETTAWAQQLVTRFDNQLEEEFFQYLWQCAALAQAGAAGGDEFAPFKKFLVSAAWRYFEMACNALPIPRGQKIKAIAKADNLLRSKLFFLNLQTLTNSGEK